MRNLLIILIIIFLVIGAYMIKTAYDINFKDPQDTKNFVVRFGRWLVQVGKNVVDTTGYVVKQTWLPAVNETNQTNP
jgi:hypothetical protein